MNGPTGSTVPSAADQTHRQVGDNRGVSNSPDFPVETVVGDDTVTIHRAPRYPRFFAAGAVAGLVVALVLTFAFSGSQGFNLVQVFGFLGVLFVVIGIGAGAVVALLVERSARRDAKTVRMQRMHGSEGSDAGDAEDTGADEDGVALP
ncbi:hypothetical protein BH09ACT6_BH09ACT6_22390 [soil metagenome]